jgi:soluble P-type ATPase
MITLSVPGFGELQLDHLVMDYNGTLAVDGELVRGVNEKLAVLAEDLSLHVLTADTFGHAKSALAGIDCEVLILPKENQDIGKLAYVQRLGPDRCVCIGNGRNDGLMLKESALGIAVILEEGAFMKTLCSSDIVCTGIISALDLLLHPLRLTATLRS